MDLQAIQPVLSVIGLAFTALAAYRAAEAKKSSAEAARAGSDMRASLAEMELRLVDRLTKSYVTTELCREYRDGSRCSPECRHSAIGGASAR